MKTYLKTYIRSVHRGNIQDSSLKCERGRENIAEVEVGRAWTTQVNFCSDDIKVGRAAVQVNFNEPAGMYETFGKAEVDKGPSSCRQS